MDKVRSQVLTFLQAQLYESSKSETVFGVGTVVSIGDGIAKVYGCEACLAGELLEFSDGALGLALNLESKAVGAVRFASSFGIYCRGRMVNALGAPVDGLGGIEADGLDTRRLESSAPSIMLRRSVHEPFATGVTAVDAMIPIGRGQRGSYDR